MMYYGLAISVCLAALFLVLACASMAGKPLGKVLAARLRSQAPATVANVFFAIRTLPLFLSVALTLGLVLPAYLKFEPRATGEPMSVKLLLLSTAGALALLLMSVRALRVLRSTARAERTWRAAGSAANQEQVVNVAGSQVPVYYVETAPALLAVTGFVRPRVFVASEVARMLSPEEFYAALNHEMAHASFFDNLKKLLLRITRLPRWLGGSATEDALWLSISEVAADEAALARGASALDLASALVKMGSLKTTAQAGDQIAASHLLPDLGGSALEMRVTRLRKLIEGDSAGPKVRRSQTWRLLVMIVIPSVLAYIAAISTLLPAVHDALEFLVR